MAVEARRMVAVQLPTAVALLLIVVVVVAEAGRIVDPEIFPKGSPISSRRAFGFLGPCLLSKSLPQLSNGSRVL
jgi:hypothetical protein